MMLGVIKIKATKLDEKFGEGFGTFLLRYQKLYPCFKKPIVLLRERNSIDRAPCGSILFL